MLYWRGPCGEKGNAHSQRGGVSGSNVRRCSHEAGVFASEGGILCLSGRQFPARARTAIVQSLLGD